MKNTENLNDRCNDCEQMFEDNVNKIVDEVDGYTRKDHRQKSDEVHAAYDEGHRRDDRHDENRESEYPKSNERTTADKMTSKLDNGMKSAAKNVGQYVDKTAEKIGDGVKSAADSVARFAEKGADKVGSTIDKMETAASHYDKK